MRLTQKYSYHLCLLVGSAVVLVVLPGTGCLSVDPRFIQPVNDTQDPEGHKSGLDEDISTSGGTWPGDSSSTEGTSLDVTDGPDADTSIATETTSDISDLQNNDLDGDIGMSTTGGVEDGEESGNEGSDSDSTSSTDSGSSTDGETSSTDTGSSTDGETSSTDSGSSTDTGSPPCVPQLCYSVNSNQSLRSYAYASGGSIYANVWTAPSTQYVVRAEIPTGKRSGTGELSIWSYNSGQYPGNYLGGGEWEVETAVKWQGVDFLPAIPINANTRYWIGMSLPHLAQFPMTNSGTLLEHRWSTNGGVSWNNDNKDQPTMFRIYCCDEPPE